MYTIQERDDDDFEEQHELDPSAGHHSDGEEGASDYDDDAVSEASSEALALAVATEEAVKEEEEAAKAPSQPRQGLTRLGSLLPRRAEAGQEGQPYNAHLASIMTSQACVGRSPQLPAACSAASAIADL